MNASDTRNKSDSKVGGTSMAHVVASEVLRQIRSVKAKPACQCIYESSQIKLHWPSDMFLILAGTSSPGWLFG
jgi:hypothetical protein